jgi:hypothetical protein
MRHAVRLGEGGQVMTRWTQIRGLQTRTLASVVMVVGAMVAVPVAAHAAPLTVVTIQFDDGNADVFQWVSTLNTHGFGATFYVNSGTIGTAGKMTWARDAYSITPTDMQSLLAWLSTQVTSGAVLVETTEQVIGGTYKPAFCC